MVPHMPQAPWLSVSLPLHPCFAHGIFLVLTIFVFCFVSADPFLPKSFTVSDFTPSCSVGILHIRLCIIRGWCSRVPHQSASKSLIACDMLQINSQFVAAHGLLVGCAPSTFTCTRQQFTIKQASDSVSIQVGGAGHVEFSALWIGVDSRLNSGAGRQCEYCRLICVRKEDLNQ